MSGQAPFAQWTHFSTLTKSAKRFRSKVRSRLRSNFSAFFFCRYFKKKAMPIPTCLSASYPQSLSHLRRNRYSNLLQRFSLDSHADSYFANQEHILGAGAVTPLTFEHRHRSSSCFDSGPSGRTVKVNSFPLTNVPEVIIMDEQGASRRDQRRNSGDSRKKKSWRERFGGRLRNKETDTTSFRLASCHFGRSHGGASSPEANGGTGSLQPGVSSLSDSQSSSNSFK